MTVRSVSDSQMDRLYAVPQRLVRIGRHRRLNLLVAGEGGPTVIFASGLNGTTLDWARVQHLVASSNRTVAFDKAGMGFSDPGPMPRTASAIVKDLRAALAAAKVAPPYVLVGHSAGGLAMRLFAFLHLQDVVGMVMVDSASEYQDRRMEEASGSGEIAAQRRNLLQTYTRLGRLARAGALAPGSPDYIRAVGLPGMGVTPAIYAARSAQRTSPGYWRAMRSESAASQSVTSDEVAAARRSLGDMPLIVLTRVKDAPRPGETAANAEARYKLWWTMHDEIVALSLRGERRTVEGAGHAIQFDKPDAVVAAIRDVLALARTG